MILEQILAAIQANTDALNRSMASSGVMPGTQASPLAPAAQLLAPPAPAPAGVDADALLALIQPHIANDAIKAALGVAMRSLGINALPETQPHQYAPLYQSFQAVLAAHGVGGPAPAPVASTSII